MDVQERLALIKSVGEEIVTEEDLLEMLREKAHPIAYDGFEPSGTDIHIAQGIFRAINVNKMTRAGVHFKIWVADWFAWMNNKLGGDLQKIQIAGNYMVEVWKACGMDLDKVEFVWSNDAMADGEYWKRVVSIARMNTQKRINRCAQIMGRKETDSLSAAQIFYPCMQCSDIFHLKADITQLGMDQRKVNILAREMGPKLGLWKPVVVSHHMLMGLGKPVSQEKDAVERAIDLKMSKSKPDSAIFMTDSEAEIKNKISKAYCPEKQTEENPIMEYFRYMIFERHKSVAIERPEKFGGNLEIGSYAELAEIYTQGKLHPMDLKGTAARYIDGMVQPVRTHFEKNARAKKLLNQVKGFSVTR